MDGLINLASATEATIEARAGAEWGLTAIRQLLAQPGDFSPTEAAHRNLAGADIVRFLERRDTAVPRSEPLPPPPGTPIGSGGK